MSVSTSGEFLSSGAVQDRARSGPEGLLTQLHPPDHQTKSTSTCGNLVHPKFTTATSVNAGYHTIYD